MKKIALYIPNLMQGGAERVVSKLALILSEKYEMTVILHSKDIQYPIDCDVISLDLAYGKATLGRVFLGLKRINKLRKIKKEQKYVCVISFLNNANIINILSCVRGVKSLVSVRNYYDANIYDKGTKLTTCILNVIYRFADSIIPVTKTMEAQLIKNANLPVSKVHTIYNPFNIFEITKNSQMDVMTDKEKCFYSDRFIFIFVGRLSHQKGIWHLLNAFSLFENDSNVGLVIVGTGEQKGQINNTITKKKLKNVLIAGSQKNPFPYMKAAGALVLSSIAEGFPNVIGEALACNLPVVSADCKTGPREILCPELPIDSTLKEMYIGSYGILVPPLSQDENWDELSTDDVMLHTAMRHIYQHTILHQQYKEKSRERAAVFSYEVALEAFSNVIEGGKSA